MEHILELTSTNQISLPDDLVIRAGLKPGSHFEARLEGERLIMEQLPFSSIEEGRFLDKTIADLQNKGRKI